MPQYKLPDKKELIQILAMFTGDSPGVESSDATNDEASHTAIYCGDDGSPAAQCHCDWKLAAGLGALLSKIPSAGAEDMVAEKELTKVAFDNLYEFMNMFSSLYMNDTTDHLRLTELVPSGSTEVPAIAGDLMETSFTIDLGDYGTGKLGFVTHAS